MIDFAVRVTTGRQPRRLMIALAAGDCKRVLPAPSRPRVIALGTQKVRLVLEQARFLRVLTERARSMKVPFA
jgi:hypothetical protein